MVKRNGPDYPHAKFIKNIPYFLNNCWEVNNQMTLYLAGITYTSSTIVNQEIYEKAKTNLKEIKHIIFFENYNENISHFFLKNYDLVLSNSDIPNIRKHDYSKELNYKDKELIIEKNKYDILLYEYAKEITPAKIVCPYIPYDISTRLTVEPRYPTHPSVVVEASLLSTA